MGLCPRPYDKLGWVNFSLETMDSSDLGCLTLL